MRPSKHDFRVRPLENLTFTDSQLKTLELPRGSQYRGLDLRLQGSLTVTIANNTAANTLRGDEWALLKNLNLRINGDTSIRYLTGDELWMLNYFYYGRFPRLCTVLGDGATGTPSVTFDSTLHLPLWDPRTDAPWDTVLESNKLSQFHLDANWGTWTDINASATGWQTTPTLEVSLHEALGGPDDPRPESGLQHPLSFVNRLQYDVAGANSQFKIPLAVGNRVYERFLINTRDTTNPAIDKNSIVNSIALKSGPVTLFKKNFKTIQEHMRSIWQLPDGYDISGNSYNRVRRNTKGDLAGWAMVDFVTGACNGDYGYIQEAIDARGYSELYLEFDAAAAGTIVVLPIGRIPV